MTDADSPNTSCMLIDTEGSAGSVGFQWNPDKSVRSVAVPWNQLRVAGRDSPIQQFGCGNAEEFEIDFDVSRGRRGDGNVKAVIDQLFQMKTASVGGFIKRPPICQYIKGDEIDIKVIILHIHAQTGQLAHPTNLLSYSGRVKVKMRKVG